MINNISFLRQGIRNLKTVGSVARSSSYLCKGMIKPVDFRHARVIVELGPGDGVITSYILNAMVPDSRLLAFEVNEVFCEKLRQIDDPRFILLEDSAEYICNHLSRLGIGQVDYIISAIPLMVLPEDLARTIVLECKKALRPGGLYIQMHYSLMMKKFYNDIFGNVSVSFVPINIPPAFVLTCEKR